MLGRVRWSESGAVGEQPSLVSAYPTNRSQECERLLSWICGTAGGTSRQGPGIWWQKRPRRVSLVKTTLLSAAAHWGRPPRSPSAGLATRCSPLSRGHFNASGARFILVPISSLLTPCSAPPSRMRPPWPVHSAVETSWVLPAATACSFVQTPSSQLSLVKGWLCGFVFSFVPCYSTNTLFRVFTVLITTCLW